MPNRNERAGRLQRLVRRRLAAVVFTATRLHTLAQGWPRQRPTLGDAPNEFLTLKALHNRLANDCVTPSA
jgi:hypothetical protein